MRTNLIRMIWISVAKYHSALHLKCIVPCFSLRMKTICSFHVFKQYCNTLASANTCSTHGVFSTTSPKITIKVRNEWVRWWHYLLVPYFVTAYGAPCRRLPVNIYRPPMKLRVVYLQSYVSLCLQGLGDPHPQHGTSLYGDTPPIKFWVTCPL